MKKRIIFFAIMLLFFNTFQIVSAQGPPPPPTYDDQNTGHGSGMNQQPNQGGSAPITSGVSILLFLGISYGILKYRAIKKQEV